MKKFLGEVLFGLLCGVGSILVFSWASSRNTGYPFCVTKDRRNYRIERIPIALITDLETKSQMFVPVDPEQLRTPDLQVSCPKEAQ